MPAPDVYPILRYRDGAAALTWLTETLGFAEHARHAGPDGRVQHAEVRVAGGMVMLGACDETPCPADVYVVVPDPDALHDRAAAAGAEITMGLRDTDYGSRDFQVADPEGHRWSFGTYRPEL